MAANEQGKFWELHDLIFANYSQLSDRKIRDLATEAGLDMARFDEDLKRNNRNYNSLIQRDMQEGQRNGVRGTPTIFVNGRLLKQRSAEGFKAVIAGEIAKKK